jgi:hypothetical protein
MRFRSGILFLGRCEEFTYGYGEERLVGDTLQNEIVGRRRSNAICTLHSRLRYVYDHSKRAKIEWTFYFALINRTIISQTASGQSRYSCDIVHQLGQVTEERIGFELEMVAPQ